MGAEVVSVTGHHLNQQQYRQPARCHRQDEGAQRSDPAPTGEQNQRDPDHAGDSDDQRHDKIGADIRVDHQLGDDGSDLTGDAAKEQRACEQPCPRQGNHVFDDTGRSAV